ncbi:MAG: hypothetical protein U5K43_07270 [Halofilum sp. (in: g-proteobacteria)]|nr:hypothetical protein [Halofilum sp. (in: g-proteobacteria)]
MSDRLARMYRLHLLLLTLTPGWSWSAPWQATAADPAGRGPCACCRLSAQAVRPGKCFIRHMFHCGLTATSQPPKAASRLAATSAPAVAPCVEHPFAAAGPLGELNDPDCSSSAALRTPVRREQVLEVEPVADSDAAMTRLIFAYIGCATFWLLMGTLVGEYLGIKFAAPDIDHVS